MRMTLSMIVVLLVTCSLTLGQEKKEEKITYEDHIKPIFRAHCFSCHNQNKKEGDLDLTNFTSLMQGGGSGAVVEPGEVGESYLFALVNHDEEPAMPPEQPKIPAEKISLLSKWIELGALENNASKAMVKKKKSFDFALSDPAVGKPTIVPLPAKLDLEPAVHAARASGTSAIASSPWAPLIAVAGQKQVLLFDSKTRGLKGILPFPEGVISVLKFSRNGSLLLAGGGRGGASGTVVVWNIKNGERIIQVGDELDTVLAADISSDQKLIALGGPQKLVRVYSTADNSLVYEIKKHTDWVTSLEFSPDGVLLCTGDRNGGVHVWEAFSGREYLTLKGHSKSISGVSWRSDSNIVATSSEDTTVRLWEMNNGSQIKSWGAHGGGSLGVEFTRDGRLVSVGRDRYAKIWDQAGKQLFAFPPFSDIAMAVTHCDESNTCYAGDWNGEIRQFNAIDGKQLGKINSNPAPLKDQLEKMSQQLTKMNATFESVSKQAEADKTQLRQMVTQIASLKQKLGSTDQAIKKLNAKLAADQQALKGMTNQQMAVEKRITTLKVAMPELKKAKTNADAAVSKLSADQELKTLAKQISDLVVKKETELSAKSKEFGTLAEKIKALSTAHLSDVKGLKKYQVELKTTQSLISQMEPKVKPLQDKSAKSTASMNVGKKLIDSTEGQVEWLKQAIEFSSKYRQLVSSIQNENKALNDRAIAKAEADAALNSMKQKMDASQAELETAKTTVASTQSEMGQMVAKIAQSKKAIESAKASIEMAKTKMTQATQVIGLLTEAKTKIETANKTSPNDSDLKQSLDAMLGLIKKQRGYLASHQKLIADNTSQINQLTKNISAMETTKTALKTKLESATNSMAEKQKIVEQNKAIVLKQAESVSKATAEVQKAEQVLATLKQQLSELQGI